MTPVARAWAAVGIAVGLAAPASAQGRPAMPRDRLEIAVGGVRLGGTALGSEPAELRAGSPASTTFRLFATETDTRAASGVEARVGYWITRSIAIEAGLLRARPELRTRISGDAEGAAGLTAVERLDQYFLDANVVWLLDRFRFRGRTVPFLSAGAGYLRQLHEGRTLVETGQVYQAGGGLRHALVRDVGWIRTIGLRLHGRVYVLVDGVQLEDRSRTHGALSGSIFLTF